MFVVLSVSSNASAGLSTHSPAAGASIRYYHLLSVGVICFLIGAITSFVILLHCHRITQAFPLDHKPIAAAAAAGSSVSMATAEKRRDVMVTSRGGGGATLQTVIQTAAVNDKLRRTSDDEVFSPARSSVSNGTSQTGLMNIRQYYRRHVADTNYSRT